MKVRLVAPRVFLSYRRADSSSITGRISSVLEHRVGKRRVFRDVVSISGGANLHSILTKIPSCTAFIAVMGSHWEGGLNGAKHISSADDWVRLELELAHKSGIKVIPLLLNDRQFPKPSELPESLRFITQLNFVRLREDDFDTDILRVLDAVGVKRWHKKNGGLFLCALIFFSLSYSVFLGVRRFRVEKLNQLMVANFERGIYDAAEAAADEILRLDAKHLRAISMKGTAAAMNYQFLTARKYFEDAFRLAPKNRVVLRNLAYSCMFSGREKISVEIYEKLRDGSPGADYSLACAYLSVGRYDDVLKLVDGIVHHQAPESRTPKGQAHILWAAALLGRGLAADRESAIEKLQFGMALDPVYWRAIFSGELQDPQNNYKFQMQILKDAFKSRFA